MCISDSENHIVMNAKKRNVDLPKAEVSTVPQTVSISKSENEIPNSFDFDVEFAKKRYTVE